VHAGQSINDIKGGLENPDEWIDEYAERTTILNDLDFINFLPLFWTPKIPPEITSMAASTFLIGHNNQFTIEAAGGPIPTISFTGALPAGVSFVENGDGTATLSGIPTGLDGFYTINLTAENGVTPPATQYCESDIGCFYNFDISMNPYLDRTRKIWVYLPPHYDPDGEGYQVIYLTSAQNLFGEQTGAHPSADWEFDEKLTDLSNLYGKGTIAVALEFDTHYPWDEYTLWNNNNMDNWVTDVVVLSSKGTSYLNFIVNTLKPIIDTSYNTLPDSENTAFGGGSRHALFALCAGLKHPETFSKVMAFSPAIWLAEGGGKLPLGQPTWFTRNQLGIWLDSNGAPSNVEIYLHIGENEWQGTGGDFPYAYTNPTDPETKLEWKDVYLRGAIKIENKLDLDGDHYHVTNESHTPSVWQKYVVDALQVLGFYP